MAQRIGRGLASAPEAQLGKHAGDVMLDRLPADEKALRDPGVRKRLNGAQPPRPGRSGAMALRRVRNGYIRLTTSGHGGAHVRAYTGAIAAK